jgi:ferredoxin
LHHELPELIKMARDDGLSVREIPRSIFNFRVFPCHIDKETCIECGLCESVCPVGAAEKEGLEERISEIVCRACGICVGACPVRAIATYYSTTEDLMGPVFEFMGKVEPVEGGPPKSCNCCPVVSQEPPRIEGPEGTNIRVSCTGRFEPALALDTITNGYDAVLVVGCLYDNYNFGKIQPLFDERLKFARALFAKLGVKADRIRHYPKYINDEKLPDYVSEIGKGGE